MTRELKPCPFCDGKGYVICGSSYTFGFPAYSVECEKCGTVGAVKGSKQEAIEAWNTRAERTCKFVADIINTAWDDEDNEIETGEVDEESDMSCGNCGYPMMTGEIGWWDEEMGPHGGYFLKPRFNCCPECGSRVIDWDGRKKED